LVACADVDRVLDWLARRVAQNAVGGAFGAGSGTKTTYVSKIRVSNTRVRLVSQGGLAATYAMQRMGYRNDHFSSRLSCISLSLCDLNILYLYIGENNCQLVISAAKTTFGVDGGIGVTWRQRLMAAWRRSSGGLADRRWRTWANSGSAGGA